MLTDRQKPDGITPISKGTNYKLESRNRNMDGQTDKNSIRDARTPQPGEIVFNIMRYKVVKQYTQIGILSEQCQCPNNV